MKIRHQPWFSQQARAEYEAINLASARQPSCWYLNSDHWARTFSSLALPNLFIISTRTRKVWDAHPDGYFFLRENLENNVAFLMRVVWVFDSWVFVVDGVSCSLSTSSVSMYIVYLRRVMHRWHPGFPLLKVVVVNTWLFPPQVL